MLTGTARSFGQFDGTGRPDDPYRLRLFAKGSGPELAAWLVPHGPRPDVTAVPRQLRTWRPGDPGLLPAALAAAFLDESVQAPEIAALVSGRGDLASGLSLLSARWIGTDGRIVPPTADPAGISVERIANVPRSRLLDGDQLAAIIGEAPANVVHIAVVNETRSRRGPQCRTGG